MEVFTALQSSRGVIIAGLIGGIISMRFVDGMTAKQRAFAIFSGATMAYYLAGAISFYFADGKFEEVIGFLIGIFGMSICGALFRAVQQSNVWDFVMRKWAPKQEAE